MIQQWKSDAESPNIDEQARSLGICGKNSGPAERPILTMDWTPEAKATIKKAPPFVRKMAQKAVEVYARNRGRATVTLEVVQEARGKMMGQSIKKEVPFEDSLPDSSSGLNMGMNRRQTMHLTDTGEFWAVNLAQILIDVLQMQGNKNR